MRHSLSSVGALVFGGAFCLSSLPSPAAAHLPWRTIGFVHSSEDPDVMALRTNRGLLLSQDGGGKWQFVCEAAMDAVGESAPVALGGGALLWGLFDGYYRSAVTGCEAARPETDLQDVRVIDMREDPTAPGAIFAISATSDFENGVFRSADGGMSWTRVGPGNASINYRELRLMPDLSRMYARVLDRTGNANVVRLQYSDDGGQTWTVNDLPDDPDFDQIDLLGVDPSDATRVYVAQRACRVDDACPPSAPPDRLLRSEDSGASWETVLEVGLLGGFEVSADTVWLGDLEGGLYASEDAGDTFEKINDVHSECLLLDDTGLYTCGSKSDDGFILARSADGGASFEGIVTFTDVDESIQCAEDVLDEAELCATTWSDLCIEDYRDDPTPPAICPAVQSDGGTPDASVTLPDAGTGTQDAGATLDDSGSPTTPTPEETSGGSSGCSSAPTGRGPWGLGASVAALALWVTRRRSRRA